jgi:hypothetical protein
MATTKKRINLSLPKDVEESLLKVARRDQIPAATKAAMLLKLALEIEEDQIFDKIASNRLKTSKKILSHEEIWK